MNTMRAVRASSLQSKKEKKKKKKVSRLSWFAGLDWSSMFLTSLAELLMLTDQLNSEKNMKVAI